MREKTYKYCFWTITILLLLLLPLFLLDRGSVVVWANRHRTPFWDYTFRYFIDYFGLAYVYLLPIGYYLFRNRRKALFFVANFGAVTIVVQSLKHFVFPNAFRPFAFQAELKLNLIKGFDYHIYNSFPSGHTSIIFSMIVLFILLKKLKMKYAFVLIISAMIIGFSRMYLAQHFFKDVYFGMLIGSYTSFLVYSIGTRYIKLNS